MAAVSDDAPCCLHWDKGDEWHADDAPDEHSSP